MFLLMSNNLSDDLNWPQEHHGERTEPPPKKNKKRKKVYKYYLCRGWNEGSSSELKFQYCILHITSWVHMIYNAFLHLQQFYTCSVCIWSPFCTWLQKELHIPRKWVMVERLPEMVKMTNKMMGMHTYKVTDQVKKISIKLKFWVTIWQKTKLIHVFNLPWYHCLYSHNDGRNIFHKHSQISILYVPLLQTHCQPQAITGCFNCLPPVPGPL